jgi:hypothetical protein
LLLRRIGDLRFQRLERLELGTAFRGLVAETGCEGEQIADAVRASLSVTEIERAKTLDRCNLGVVVVKHVRDRTVRVPDQLPADRGLDVPDFLERRPAGLRDG